MVAYAVRNICAVYEEDAIAVRTVRDWHANFKNGNFTSKMHLVITVQLI